MSIRLFGVTVKVDFLFYTVICISLLNSGQLLSKLLICSICHEAGHILMLYCVGGKADFIKLSGYGMALKYSSKLSRVRECLVLLSGPAVNLALYIFFNSEISLLLFILNLLPVYPLDGGRVMSILFPNIYRYISLFCLIVFTVISICIIIRYKAFSLLFICIYLIIYSCFY